MRNDEGREGTGMRHELWCICNDTSNMRYGEWGMEHEVWARRYERPGKDKLSMNYDAWAMRHQTWSMINEVWSMSYERGGMSIKDKGDFGMSYAAWAMWHQPWSMMKGYEPWGMNCEVGVGRKLESGMNYEASAMRQQPWGMMNYVWAMGYERLGMSVRETAMLHEHMAHTSLS